MDKEMRTNYQKILDETTIVANEAIQRYARLNKVVVKVDQVKLKSWLELCWTYCNTDNGRVTLYGRWHDCEGNSTLELLPREMYVDVYYKAHKAMIAHAVLMCRETARKLWFMHEPDVIFVVKVGNDIDDMIEKGVIHVEKS